ncbi:O-antigen ligase family protein [Geodermatophilus sp. SYSU D00965]
MRAGEREAPATSVPVRLLCCMLLLVLTTVGWRRGTYFTGSLDPVVVAKGALSVLALTVAFFGTRRPHLRVGTGTLWALGILLATTVLGALTHGPLTAGGIIAVRVTIIALTVVLLLRCYTTAQFFAALARACAVIGGVAAVTGLPTLSSGRLAGGFPQMAPNELALLASLVVLYAGWRIAVGGAGVGTAAVAVVALGVLWCTGSRTALLMLLPALLVMAVHVRRAPVGMVVGGLLGAVGAVVAVFGTDALSSFLERDGEGTSTVQSRFVAWDAATTWADDRWQLAFGGGLSVKIIRVKGQYWDEQPLDSSWMSLLVQAGLLGLLVAGIWALWAVRGALLAPRVHRALFLGLLVFLLGRSVLESGLFDATPDFLAFLAASLLAEGGSRRRLAAEDTDDGAPTPTGPATAPRSGALTR